jgi:hypothetical protein
METDQRLYSGDGIGLVLFAPSRRKLRGYNKTPRPFTSYPRTGLS